MSRKILVLSGMLVALVAVTFDTNDAEAARCCRNRSQRCCHARYHGGCNQGCNTGYAACGNTCNTGCNVAYAATNCNAVQPCSYQAGGCPVGGGQLIAQPYEAQPAAQPAAAQPAPPPPADAPAPAPGN